MTLDELADRLRDDIVTADVRLLILYGSRARGDAGSESDWDFAYLGDQTVDIVELSLAITGLLETDRVDVVDLAKAGAVLRYHAARDGVALIQRDPDAFLEFRLEASLFWCDVEVVVRAAHRDVLVALG